MQVDAYLHDRADDVRDAVALFWRGTVHEGVRG